jgi:methionyl-tRNA synthetase
MARHLITSALPYANGPIHLGHMVEYVQTDIRARFLRMEGHEVLYVCADDTHGTPIELSAHKLGITPEEVIARSYKDHTRDFAAFRVAFDEYYTTNSSENKDFASRIYRSLRDAGHTEKKVSQQLYSEGLGRFLSDRMVRGTCPRCGAGDQYGDACEVCKTTYEPTELLNPVDAIEGKIPTLRETEHIYVRLADFTNYLEEWIQNCVPQESVRNLLRAWIDGGLKSWCISRDAPYFGFEIPDEPGKFFYVWLDAPVGYMAATRHWCERNGKDWRDYWGADSDVEITHVIGKDIVYFHTLFWPAMLHAGGFRAPTQVRAHGFLTVDGVKMSKSRGTFIKAATYLRHLDADYLRFYYATRIGIGVEDIDIQVNDFVARINADLINNCVNLASRVTKFVDKRFGGKVVPFDPGLYRVCGVVDNGIAAVRGLYDQWDFRGAVRKITEIGDAVNLFFQEAEPWKLINTDPDEAQRVCSVALYGTTSIMTALAPICPGLAERYAAAIGVPVLTWEHAHPAFQPSHVYGPDRLLNRLESTCFQGILEESGNG